MASPNHTLSPDVVLTGTTIELLTSLILRAADARLIRIQTSAVVIFASKLGGPEHSLPLSELTAREVRRVLAVKPIQIEGEE